MDDSTRKAPKDTGDAPKDIGQTPPGAGDALSRRADELLARTSEGPVPLTPDRYEGVRGPELAVRIDELEEIGLELRALPAPGRPLAMVEARLGVMTATRYVLDGRPEDRVRALELLEAARVSRAL